MFDFNDVIENNNIIDNIQLNLLDINVVFFNCYKLLINAEIQDNNWYVITNLVGRFEQTESNHNNLITHEIIETLFFNLYKIIIKIKKNNGLYEIFLSSNNNGVLNHCNFKDNFYSFTKQYHFRYETGGYKEEIIIIWSDAYFKIIEVFDGRYFIMFNPNITIKDKEYLINLFNLTTFQETLKFTEVKEQNILNYIKEYV